MEQFDIPVVVFFFKRAEKTALVIDRIAKVRPKKLYLISDGPRNELEAADVLACRKHVEERITWPCEVIRNYAETNKGVFDRIGLGAQWVLSQESSAIFLEDDNLPELSFFPFCKEMLTRYQNDDRVLWVCGTNYLREYEPEDGSSYVFTHHMLPCGWASWGHKFSKYYQGDLSLLDDPYIQKRVMRKNQNSALARQDMQNWIRERRRILKGGRANSWDYQMSFTLRVYDLYGIVPNFNQINNIGVDAHSTHGGTVFSNIMTQRFCGLETKELIFPLRHPKAVLTDLGFESAVAKIILFPLRYRAKGAVTSLLKFMLTVPDHESLIPAIKKRVKFFICKSV